MINYILNIKIFRKKIRIYINIKQMSGKAKVGKYNVNQRVKYVRMENDDNIAYVGRIKKRHEKSRQKDGVTTYSINKVKGTIRENHIRPITENDEIINIPNYTPHIKLDPNDSIFNTGENTEENSENTGEDTEQKDENSEDTTEDTEQKDENSEDTTEDTEQKDENSEDNHNDSSGNDNNLRINSNFIKRGKGGKGLGSSKRKKPKPKRQLNSFAQIKISKGSIRRLCRRAGIKRIAENFNDELKSKCIKTFLEDIIKDAIVYTEFGKRKTITYLDIIYALKRRNMYFYGNYLNM